MVIEALVPGDDDLVAEVAAKMFRYIWQRPFGGLAALWKYQLVTGILLVAAGVVILLVPAILVALVAALVMLAGTSLIASALRARRFERSQDASQSDPLQWW